VFPSRRFYADDLSRPELTFSGPSQMTLSETPGVGAEPEPERLRQQTLEQTTLG
jgi:hypothetical protein